uniref:G domain-containing protein n=1 Tax=Anabas testudineus TaxID=64144 RepID=A0A7N6AWC2_ANATE
YFSLLISEFHSTSFSLQPWEEISLNLKQPHLNQLRILLHGPVGAGKSSFINSIQSVLLGRMYKHALAANVFENCFTKKVQRKVSFHHVSSIVFSDIMGLGPDKVHVLVCSVVQKIREVRAEASRLGIPQLIILTKIDEVCPEIKEDLRNVYKIKYLKERSLFSVEVGIPMNCIFPVNDVNSLILSALRDMIHAGEDHIHFNQNKAGT